MLLLNTIWILLKPGKIAEIYGIEEVMNLRGMLGHVQRLHIGDCVKEEMFETEKSAIARFWVEANSKESLENLEKKIRSSISVIDINGNDMIWNGEGVDI